MLELSYSLTRNVTENYQKNTIRDELKYSNDDNAKRILIAHYIESYKLNDDDIEFIKSQISKINSRKIRKKTTKKLAVKTT